MIGLESDKPQANTGKIRLAKSLQNCLGLDDKAAVNNDYG